MGDPSPTSSSTVGLRKAQAKPLTGGILGVVIGICIAVVLQQQGVWPLDQLSLFLLPAVIGLLGVLLTTIGRESAPTALGIMLVLLLAMGVWGGLGFTNFGEHGQLNGGCTAGATTPLDTTTVVDTSRGDPFLIDPHAGLDWNGTSPTPFRNYTWEIWVDIGGFPITVADGEESNDEGKTSNSGQVANVSAQATSRGIPIDQIRGVLMVGGYASTCDGFGFVKLVSSGFLETLIAKAAAGLALVLLAILLLVALTGRTRPLDMEAETVFPDDMPGED